MVVRSFRCIMTFKQFWQAVLEHDPKLEKFKQGVKAAWYIAIKFLKLPKVGEAIKLKEDPKDWFVIDYIDAETLKVGHGDYETEIDISQVASKYILFWREPGSICEHRLIGFKDSIVAIYGTLAGTKYAKDILIKELCTGKVCEVNGHHLVTQE